MKRFVLLSLLGLVINTPSLSWAEEQAAVKRTQDVVYGRKFGTALTMDVFQPAKPNGIGIILIVSGGWVSNHDLIGSGLFKSWLDPVVRRNYTVFAVCHGCQPKFTIPEIFDDLHRAVRFIRHNAAKYGVDPDRLGVMGGSAGGHLSLVLGTMGKKGSPNAVDRIDRESSAVQCVACFFPPTDFLNYGRPGEDAVGVGTLKGFRAAFGLKVNTPEERQEVGKTISPIYFVSNSTPPVLIIHGDADKLVPIYQAEMFVKRCEELKVPAKLIVKEGAAHGWKDFPNDVALFADWFDQHLLKAKK